MYILSLLLYQECTWHGTARIFLHPSGTARFGPARIGSVADPAPIGTARIKFSAARHGLDRHGFLCRPARHGTARSGPVRISMPTGTGR